ncbi:MAG: TSUP family transporter, partial [Pseudomonadota bacterium]
MSQLLNVVAPWQWAILLGGSFLGSFMTAAAGVGGGAFLIMVMGNVVPPLALVPVHGFVQLGSNAGRAALTRRHADVPAVLAFTLGTVLAAAVSLWLVSAIDSRWIPLIVAVFILYTSWLPMPQVRWASTRAGLASGGLLTTMASMLV